MLHTHTHIQYTTHRRPRDRAGHSPRRTSFSSCVFRWWQPLQPPRIQSHREWRAQPPEQVTAAHHFLGPWPQVCCAVPHLHPQAQGGWCLGCVCLMCCRCWMNEQRLVLVTSLLRCLPSSRTSTGWVVLYTVCCKAGSVCACACERACVCLKSQPCEHLHVLPPTARTTVPHHRRLPTSPSHPSTLRRARSRYSLCCSCVFVLMFLHILPHN